MPDSFKRDSSRRDVLRSGLLAAASACLVRHLPRAAAGESGAASSVKPNFIFILADDLGYADLSCYGSRTIKTPNIDRMCDEGMKFTAFYTTSPVCTPTRSSLMTGCYPRRIGLHQHVLFPNSLKGLNPDEITVAEVLKTQGYATAAIGKWHLGHHKPFLPTRQGFDYYYGIPYSNDMPTPTADGRKGCILLRNEEVVEHPTDQTTLTERYTEESIRFIRANRDKPFFLYLPHNFPHVPLHVSERFKGRSAGGLFGDVVECIDWGVGEILKALGELGIDRNTFVIFTSDNGPDRHPAPPLRGTKGTTWEGGMRVPCVMRWPGAIPAGRACSELATVMDILPTFARLAGASAPADRVIDGKDIWPLAAGQAGAKTPYEAFFYHTAQGRLAGVRVGDWKLHLEPPGAQTRPATRPAQGAVATRPAGPLLFDLGKDIGETTNLARQHPDVVQRLVEMCRRFDEEIVRNSRPPGLVPKA